MKKNPVLQWSLRTIRPWIPALIVLVLCNVAGAIFGVMFALRTRELINSVDPRLGGNVQDFTQACIVQGALILAMLLNSMLIHHLKDRLSAVMDRDMKKKMLLNTVTSLLAQVVAVQVARMMVMYRLNSKRLSLT